MKISICGTRGIPNNYGGFEQCAERLAVLLVKAGHTVTVYNPDYHPYKEGIFNGVEIIAVRNPEKSIGTLGNFFYDYKCLRHAYTAKNDAVIMLGYTTSSLFFPFLKRNGTALITNMDGLEWKRDKWNYIVKKIARGLEWMGARYSDFLIADNREIQNYLQREYKRAATFIAYGADLFITPNESILSTYNCTSGNYDLLIARLEKENNIEMMLDGVVKSNGTVPFLVIGNYDTPYGRRMKEKYSSSPSIRFIGAIYNLEHLNNIRHFGRFYFHGHSVGGTNPSLLEAMASSALIIAHDNPFNRDVLGVNAFYFSTAFAVSQLLNNAGPVLGMRDQFIQQNQQKIEQEYNWKLIADQYEELCKEASR